MKTYIIGHRKPDTDAVVAAMALAELYKQKDCFGYSNAVPVITDPLNPETEYLFQKFEVDSPKEISASNISDEDKIVLVDHNEEAQRLTGIKAEQITEIVDHHKANINFNSPIFLNFKPWGSTCTIVYFFMKKNDIVPDKTLASLMLAAIISDTVNLKSATSTNKDKKYLQELAKLAEITDIDAFALEIFKAKSSVTKLSDEEIVKNDYKIYDFGDKKVFINQIETVEQDLIFTDKKAGILAAMASVKTAEKVDLLFVVVSDILNVNSKIILLSNEEQVLSEKAFNTTAKDQIIDIGPKLSRKKEIAPAIEKAIKHDRRE
ncbi:MAG: manganese-dependent inorganic pyrophosphatase [Patescibacteria group bacterium]